MGQAPARPGHPGSTSAMPATGPTTEDALLASALAQGLCRLLPPSVGNQSVDPGDADVARVAAAVAAREAQLRTLPPDDLRLALGATAAQLAATAAASATSLDGAGAAGLQDDYEDRTSHPGRQRKPLSMVPASAAAATAASFESLVRRRTSNKLLRLGNHQDMLEEEGPCERHQCATTACVLAFLDGDNGTLLCAACDRAVHLHRRASHRYTLVATEACVRGVLRELMVDEFLSVPSAAAGGASTWPSSIERVGACEQQRIECPVNAQR